jgi:tetratricopeptide (TPR) repeat protein
MNKRIFPLLVSLFFVVAAKAQSSDPVISAFSKSYELEKKTDYKGAVTALKAVYDDGSYEINLRLGWLEYSAGQFTESMSYYQKCIDLLPYSIEARLGYALPASAVGDWDKIVAQYKKILEIDPQNSLTNYRMGMIMYERKDYQSAYNFFGKVVNLYPFDYDSLLMYAWSNYQLGKLREAKILFNKVLMYSPTDKSATEGLGLIK